MFSIRRVIDINARRLHDIHGRHSVTMSDVEAGPR